MNEVAQSRQPRPWGAAIGTVLTFLVLGPPVGAAAFTYVSLYAPWLGAFPAPADKSLADLAAGGILAMIFTLPFSYIIGGQQAAISGMVMATYGWFRGKPPIWVPLGAGLAAFLFSLAVDISGTFFETRKLVVIYLIAHLGAALFCGLMARTFWQERP